jgi:hypothetical protein
MDSSESEFNLLLPVMFIIVISPVLFILWLLLRHFDRQIEENPFKNGFGVAGSVFRTIFGLVIFMLMLGFVIISIEAILKLVRG